MDHLPEQERVGRQALEPVRERRAALPLGQFRMDHPREQELAWERRAAPQRELAPGRSRMDHLPEQERVGRQALEPARERRAALQLVRPQMDLRQEAADSFLAAAVAVAFRRVLPAGRRRRGHWPVAVEEQPRLEPAQERGRHQPQAAADEPALPPVCRQTDHCCREH
jgi:hypothetical protein